MLKSHVAFKLTRQGGPDPVSELQRVFEAAQDDPAGVSWVATRKPGAGFTARSDSQLLAFALDEEGNCLALTARVVSRHDTLPRAALVRDMYEDYEDVFRAYWRIGDVNLKLIPYEELPGTTAGGGLRIPDAFRRGQMSFAYWLPEPSAEASAPGRRVDPARVKTQPSSAYALSVPVPSAVRLDRPTVPLHGVDFSGARETGGRNGKIWIATWRPDRAFVQLKSGGDDPGIDRSGLATMVIEGGGTWVVDFPFGPPAAVAEVAGWATWREYLAWCGSDPNPTTLRDQLREDCRLADVHWSTKRAIDRSLGTTWFPFFEQLYRQTITGGRDVLFPLSQAKRDRTRILPFHDCAPATNELSVVVEGFPGATLANYGLPSTGYKHKGCAAEEQRRLIVDSLIGLGIPISGTDASTAAQDAEGDAVDALVLLCAAWNASRREADWRDRVGEHSAIEGWFFD
ncbi:MAG: DUF429 domain-containing protein [Acidobacteria bacterium]|nr:DUF429 domain-containing protein [Acidobacteriota bacterium]